LKTSRAAARVTAGRVTWNTEGEPVTADCCCESTVAAVPVC
jgi:hypothetical protein